MKKVRLWVNIPSKGLWSQHGVGQLLHLFIQQTWGTGSITVNKVAMVHALKELPPDREGG